MNLEPRKEAVRIGQIIRLLVLLAASFGIFQATDIEIDTLVGLAVALISAALAIVDWITTNWARANVFSRSSVTQLTGDPTVISERRLGRG